MGMIISFGHFQPGGMARDVGGGNGVRNDVSNTVAGSDQFGL